MKKSILLKTLVALGVFLIVGNEGFAQEYRYIGANKCKMCHNKPAEGEQYNKWADGPHANAMASLSEEEAENPECLKCHSTFHAVDEELHRGIKDDEGVSCESCHGPGSRYKSMSIMRNREKSLENGMIIPDEEVCIKCHNEESPTFKGFNYEEYVQRIIHDNPNTTEPEPDDSEETEEDDSEETEEDSSEEAEEEKPE